MSRDDWRILEHHCPGGIPFEERHYERRHEVVAVFATGGVIEKIECHHNGRRVDGCIDWSLINTYPQPFDWKAGAQAQVDAEKARRQAAEDEAEVARLAIFAEKRAELMAHPAWPRISRTFGDDVHNDDTSWVLECPNDHGRGTHAVTMSPDGSAASCEAEGCPGGKWALKQLGLRPLSEFLAEHRPSAASTADEVIPGVFRLGERLILTGFEGAGKSTFSRQVSQQVASGVHPFERGVTFRPQPVLYVDLENGPKHTTRKFDAMIATSGVPASELLSVESHLGGKDFTDPKDQEWFLTLAEHVRLVVFGSLYTATDRDLADEGAAAELTAFFNKVREATGVAMIIEAHCGHGVPGRKRPIRPYGSSRFLRWPEYGLHLAATGEIAPYRVSREDGAWPEQLYRGAVWPWEGQAPAREINPLTEILRTADGVPVAAEAILAGTATEPTLRELIDAGVTKTTALRRLKNLGMILAGEGQDPSPTLDEAA